METVVQTYPCNTLQDLEIIPDWIFQPLNQGYGRRVPPNLSEYILKFGQALFDENTFPDTNIPNYSERIKTFIQKSMLSSLFELLSEQRTYFYDLRTGETKPDLIARLQKQEYYTDEPYQREKDCSIWLTVASINQQPYGAIFSFYNPNSPKNLMVQGISKFLTPVTFSLFYPELGARLPKLNSLLLPAVETLAINFGVQRIIVDPFENQGRILQKHYGFEPIADGQKVCDLIRPKWGIPEAWLAKNISSDEFLNENA